MRLRNIISFVLPLLACFMAVIGCSEKRDLYSPSAAPLTGDPGQENCGFDTGEEVPDGPIIDPCGPDAQLLHGPVSMTPEPSSPSQSRVDLDITEVGFVCVTLTVEKIASATVTLNGEMLFAQNDFSGKVEQLSRVAPVEEGEAVLEFEVRATRHGSFTYEVRYIPLDPVPRGEISGNNNRLSVYNLRDHPDPFSPEKQDGIRDTVTMSVTASVDRDGISPNSANEYVIYGTFEIASPTSCQEIARLTTQLTLAKATPTSTDREYLVPLTVVWDGRDNSSAFVDGGTYFYRAVAELVKVTPPGSSRLLDIAYSEILTVTNDDIPPSIFISPANGELIETDMPLLETGYEDEGSGVAIDTLSILLNGSNVTDLFNATESYANLQLTIDNYLEEGTNQLSVGISDIAGNIGNALSTFTVQTPTDVLLEDLGDQDTRYRRRSAYKLLFRTDEITLEDLHRCLNQLGQTPESKAVNRLLELAQDSSAGVITKYLAIISIASILEDDPEIRNREDVIDAMCTLLMNDESFYVKGVAAGSLGLTRNAYALACLEEFATDGPYIPEKPHDKTWEKSAQYEILIDAVRVQTVRSIALIAGHAYEVGNPGLLETIRRKCMEHITEFLSNGPEKGGGP